MPEPFTVNPGREVLPTPERPQAISLPNVAIGVFKNNEWSRSQVDVGSRL